MDPTLTQLARTADGGEVCPRINILAGNSLFVGTPTQRQGFEEVSERQVAESIYYSKKPTKATMESAYAESTSQASEIMAGLRSALATAEGGEVVTLRDVEIWSAAGGDGIAVPIVRVPIAAVDGWWVGAGKRLAGRGGGGFVGVVAPIPEI